MNTNTGLQQWAFCKFACSLTTICVAETFNSNTYAIMQNIWAATLNTRDVCDKASGQGYYEVRDISHSVLIEYESYADITYIMRTYIKVIWRTLEKLYYYKGMWICRVGAHRNSSKLSALLDIIYNVLIIKIYYCSGIKMLNQHQL